MNPTGADRRLDLHDSEDLSDPPVCIEYPGRDAKSRIMFLIKEGRFAMIVLRYWDNDYSSWDMAPVCYRTSQWRGRILLDVRFTLTTPFTLNQNKLVAYSDKLVIISICQNLDTHFRHLCPSQDNRQNGQRSRC